MTTTIAPGTGGVRPSSSTDLDDSARHAAREERRRRWRRRLLLAGLVPLLLTLLFTGQVILMLHFDRAGREDYGTSDFTGARDAFTANGRLNLLQRWVSPYDEGTAQYRLDDFRGAVGSFQTALATVPAAEECRVRIDLALSHESVGDVAVAGGDLTTARAEWTEGVAVLTDGGCQALAGDLADGQPSDQPSGQPSDPPSDQPGDVPRSPASVPGSTTRAEAQDAITVGARLRAKLQQLPGPGAVAAGTAAGTDGSAAALLANRNERGERLRRDAEQQLQDRLDQQQQQQENPDGHGQGHGQPPVYAW